MIATDIGGATALPSVDRANEASSAEVAPGTVHLAVPFTTRWKLLVNGAEVAARPAFGLTTAFDVVTPGSATVSYKRTMLHSLLVLTQFVAWCAFIFVAMSRRKFSFRRTRHVAAIVVDEPAIVMDDGGPS